MAFYVRNKCPVCTCTSYSIFGRINELKSPVSIPTDSAIVRCSDCKLIYVNPMPYWDNDDYAKLYDETYFLHLNSEEQKEWLEIRKSVIPSRRFSRIHKYIKSDIKKLLEIGAGENAFMCRYLLSRGWNCTAQEPSQLFAEKLLDLKGLNIETKSIKELTGEYSFIFADSVLEHVPDPITYYKKLSELLAPGGVLYTVSPNEYSMYNFLLNFIAMKKGNTPHYIAPYTQPYHLIGFTKKSLHICAKESGLRFISYKKIDDYMAFHALRSKKRAFVKYPLALLYAFAQGIGLGTNGEAMFVKDPDYISQSRP